MLRARSASIGLDLGLDRPQLAGNYPNKLDAPAGVAKPKIWDSVATNDYVSHTSDEVHRSNAGMASAGQQSDVSIGVPLGGFDFGEVDTKGVATIDKDHPSRRSGPQTLLGPNDTTSARDLYNHTFTNQMTFSMKNLQMAETNRAAQPLTGKTSWPELVGLDGKTLCSSPPRAHLPVRCGAPRSKVARGLHASAPARSSTRSTAPSRCQLQTCWYRTHGCPPTRLRCAVLHGVIAGLEAKRVIQREAGPKIKIELIPRGSRIAEDVKTNRVRIFVRADNNKVAAAPRIA